MLSAIRDMEPSSRASLISSPVRIIRSATPARRRKAGPPTKNAHIQSFNIGDLGAVFLLICWYSCPVTSTNPIPFQNLMGLLCHWPLHLYTAPDCGFVRIRGGKITVAQTCLRFVRIFLWIKKRKDRRSLSFRSGRNPYRRKWWGPSFKDWPGGQTETAADVMRVLDTPQDAFRPELGPIHPNGYPL